MGGVYAGAGRARAPGARYGASVITPRVSAQPSPGGADGASAAQTAYRAVLLAGALVAAGLLFRELATLFLAVVMTIVIAFPLATLANHLSARGVPRVVGV